MKNKIIKKVGSISKSLLKKADKHSAKVAEALKKQWKKEEPEREKYKKELKEAASAAGAKGLELLNEGIKNSIKIGGDVADTIKKDLKEISENKTENNSKNNK